MARRTIYTTTITVPVYASWKCEKCGEINFSKGELEYAESKGTSAIREFKHKEAEETAHQKAQLGWRRNAYNIIMDPHHHPTEIRSGLFFVDTHCAKCDSKPRWDKNVQYLQWVSIAFSVFFLSLFAVITMPTSIIAWIALLLCVGVIIYSIITEARYKKIMLQLPEEYTPIIGSLNEELIEYAKMQGDIIPTPEETVAIAENAGKRELGVTIFCREEVDIANTNQIDDDSNELEEKTKIVQNLSATKVAKCDICQKEAVLYRAHLKDMPCGYNLCMSCIEKEHATIDES